MTAEMARGQAGATTKGPAGLGSAREARQPGLPDRTVRYGIWAAVAMRSLVDHRFVTSVITRALGVYALFSVIKNNQARPMRRVIHWYNIRGQVHGIKALHQARRLVESGNG